MNTKLIGIIFILLGIVFSFVGINFQQSLQNNDFYLQTLSALIVTLSIGLISMGALSIMIGMKDWQEYFERRLSEVIRKKEYISSLNRDELIQLQRDTFRSYFNIEVDNNPSNFLSFFESELQKLIGEPYREDTDFFMNIKSIDGDVLTIEENVRFRARRVAGSIQESISWRATPDEYISFDSACIKIRTDKKFSSNYKVDEDGYHEVDQVKINFLDDAQGFEFSLDDFKDNDFIDVVVFTSYKSDVSRYLSWTMSKLTDRFTITITYPEMLNATCDVLGINDENINVNKGRSTVTIKCNTWALPNTGVVMSLRKDIN